MSKIYAALVSTFTASEIYARDSVQGGNKGGWQKVSPEQKPAKTVKGAIPPTTTPGVWNLSGIFATHLIL